MNTTLLRERTRSTNTFPSPRAAAAVVVGIAILFAVVHAWGDHLAARMRLGLGVPPLHVAWDPRVHTATAVAVITGVALVAVSARVAARVPPRRLPLAVGGGGLVWSVVLAAADGERGLVGGVVGPHGYLAAVPRVGAIGPFLHDFAAAAHDGTLPVHVTGHPPGFVVLLSLLDRLGFGGPRWAAAVCILGGAAALSFVTATVTDVAGERWARAAAPFLVVSPAAVWIATTPDAFFAGAGALAVFAFARATSATRARGERAALAGVAFGAALMLSYGLALLAVVLVTIAWRRDAWRELAIALAAAGALLLAVAAFGFSWLDGLAATRHAYWRGIASTRPYRYFVVANIAAFAACIGPATVIALVWLRDRALVVLTGAALVAVAFADLSAMSKGEVERIWLPFALWLLPAGALFASRRRWTTAMLALQLVTAIALQVSFRTS